MPEDPNLSTPKFCARSGVTDCVLFCHGTCPVRLDTGTLGHCQPPRNARISMTVTFCCTGLADSGAMPPMKCWEIVADKLSAAGWSWGYCSAVTRDGWRWVVDARREGRRYIVHSDELLSAFLGVGTDAAITQARYCSLRLCLTVSPHFTQKSDCQ